MSQFLKIPGLESAPEPIRSAQVAPDVESAAKVVRSGLSYKLVCASCGQTIRRDVRTERAAVYNAERVAAHLEDCAGSRKRLWWRKLFS